jgi:hypothetical protein
MRNNTTPLRRFNAGRPKGGGLNPGRKTFSPKVSTNYKMMLELYCINKEANSKKDLRYQRSATRKRVNTAEKPAFLITTVISFFEESLLLLKKLKPRFAMATVAEL